MWVDDATARLELFDRFVVALATRLPLHTDGKGWESGTSIERTDTIIQLAALLVEKRMRYFVFLKEGDGASWDEWIHKQTSSV